MSLIERSMILSLGMVAVAGAATSALPANDTYIDSSNQNVNADYAHANYGHFGVIKAVYNTANDTTYGPSIVHSLLTLPQPFLLAAANGVSSAVVQFQVKTNKLIGSQTDYYSTTAALYPLTHGYTAGTGGVVSQTQDSSNPHPTAPNSPTPVGADYYTYDGKTTDTWSAPGGDYNPIGSAAATFTATGTAFANFDITALVDNPITFAQIRDNGLLLRITQDTDSTYYADNATLSLVSADVDSTSGTNPFGTAGSVIYTVPEPASAALMGMAVILMRRRTTHR